MCFGLGLYFTVLLFQHFTHSRNQKSDMDQSSITVHRQSTNHKWIPLSSHTCPHTLSWSFKHNEKLLLTELSFLVMTHWMPDVPFFNLGFWDHRRKNKEKIFSFGFPCFVFKFIPNQISHHPWMSFKIQAVCRAAEWAFSVRSSQSYSLSWTYYRVAELGFMDTCLHSWLHDCGSSGCATKVFLGKSGHSCPSVSSCEKPK